MASPATPPVDASIIVSAHNRRQYLSAAVESVLAQEVDRLRYEIIVVKNFDDQPIDDFLTRIGAKIVRCDEQPVTRKVAAGLRSCTGRVVFLLDDDDLFEPSKLRTVLSRFDADPRLGFYHNRFVYVDSSGQPLPAGAVRPFGMRSLERSRRFYVDAAAKSKELHRLAYCYPDFNISSVVFRRELISDVYSYLSQLDGALDTFLLFRALLSPYNLLFDDVALTRYRVHSDNMTLAAGEDARSRRARLLMASNMLDRSYALIREMTVRANQPELVHQIEGRALVNRLTRVFRDPLSQRVDALRILLGAIRLRDTYAVRENIASWAGAFLFLFSPRLARRGYDRQMAI